MSRPPHLEATELGSNVSNPIVSFGVVLVFDCGCGCGHGHLSLPLLFDLLLRTTATVFVKFFFQCATE
jgi:hypothetical protein